MTFTNRRLQREANVVHLNRLRTFIRVVECASFSGAARTLNVSQSAVSQQIKALEAALGTRLLLRGADQVVPTASGKLVHEQALRIIDLWEELLTKLQHSASDDAARLLIGSSTVPSTYVLGQVMYRFRRLHPLTEVSVRVGDSTVVWDWVHDDVVDIGVTGMFRSVPGIDHRPLVSDTIVLIAPCSHPWAGHTISPGELQNVPFIWRAAGSGTRKAIEDAFFRWGLDPDSVPRTGELGSTEAVVSAVEAGLGLSFVSSHAVRPALALERICTVRVDSPPIERQFYLIYKSSRADDPLLASFIKSASGDEEYRT